MYDYHRNIPKEKNEWYLRFITERKVHSTSNFVTESIFSDRVESLYFHTDTSHLEKEEKKTCKISCRREECAHQRLWYSIKKTV